MSVKFTSRIKEWSATAETKLDKAVLSLATDIDRVAKINAPKDSGDLAKSGRITHEESCHYKVTFGDKSVPYARRRHYENKLHPSTLRYLERAGDDNSRNFKKYLKEL